MPSANSAPPTATELVPLYRSSIESYSADCLVIRTKAAMFSPLLINEPQQIVHEKLSSQLKSRGFIKAIILKARQEGISTYVAARFFRRCTLYSNQRALIIADQKKRSQEIFSIYETYNRKLPSWISPKQKTGQAGLKISWDKPDGTGLNSSITVETARDAAAGRGSTVQAVHASEMGFWENPEAVWVSVQQAVPDYNSEVIIESTANGVGNLFHQIWTDAENGENDFVPIFLPWWIHKEYSRPVDTAIRTDIMNTLTKWEFRALNDGIEYEGELRKLTIEQLYWRRATIKNKLNGDERLFMQEYPATADEAFLVSGECFFDTYILQEYKELALKPKRFRIHEGLGGGILRIPDPKGELRVWKKPEPGGEYVIFADTATGRQTSERTSYYTQDREKGGRDFSCAWVFDVNSNSYVAKLHGRIPPEIFALKLSQLGHLYANPSPISHISKMPALIGVENNHKSGVTVLKILKKDLKYPNLYMDRMINKRLDRVTQTVGWFTTEAKRTLMLDEFSASLRAGEVVLPDVQTIGECQTFVLSDSGKPEAVEGCHDDRVISAAGALQMAKVYHRPGRRLKRREPMRAPSGTGLYDYGEERQGGSFQEEAG